MLVGFKKLTISNDGLRYSLVLLEKVLVSSITRCNDIGRKCLVELVYRERDAFIAQGTSSVLYDRLYTASDTYEMFICNVCLNPMSGDMFCDECCTDNISKVQLPFSCKLLLQELQAMGLKVLYKPNEC